MENNGIRELINYEQIRQYHTDEFETRYDGGSGVVPKITVDDLMAKSGSLFALGKISAS